MTLNSYLNLMSKIISDHLEDKSSTVYCAIVLCLMYVLWYIHCQSDKDCISKNTLYKFEKELLYSSRLYSLLEILKKITEEQSHFIDLDLRNDLSNIHWDLVNLEYTMAQIIPEIEIILLNHSRKAIKYTPKDDDDDTNKRNEIAQESTDNQKETEDTDRSTKVLQDLEERWRQIRSNLRINIELTKKNTKQSDLNDCCGDDNKRTSVYNNMMSIKHEVNRELSSHKKTRDDYKITSPISSVSTVGEQIEDAIILDSKNLNSTHTKLVTSTVDNSTSNHIDNKTITILQDKTKTFYDSESLFSIDMRSSSSLEKNIQPQCTYN